MLSHAIKNTIRCRSEDSDHLPLCQTPSLKRIYTKAHSLNLHLLDLHPESRGGMATRRGGERQREDSSDSTQYTVHKKAMNRADIVVSANTISYKFEVKVHVFFQVSLWSRFWRNVYVLGVRREDSYKALASSMLT